ncbi:TMV resistance protein N isoform X2 [Lactuca sativa]|uniref:TMV resistance protein N isoform X2 n=1 Tax=Lactuca sativa TaxID=4236 RepID=UPI001C68F61D|nr:TMV resistance protein N isoform X2 [Lactuca sativa]
MWFVMHESQGIKQIVVEISQKVQLVASSANENLIGISVRMQRLKSELQIGSGGVRMIGIWGVGGGGKTTLASAVYEEISREFDGCCFVDNIREKSSKNRLEKLQKEILSDVLKQKQTHVRRVEEGRHMIKGRLCQKKVLIVLDDVDRLDQLKALAGSHNWFGDGSRIIITTRDEHLLTAHRVNVIHDIRLLNDNESLMLIRKHAPRDSRPVEDYEHLSKEVVSYAGGLPLALTVLGSFLCDKDINEWRSALARLKEIPDIDILKKLKISYDGLTKLEKDLFLDIACFFRRQDKDDAMKILDACGFQPVIGIKVLVQKALITISEYGEFDMHDLVQEMAHYIVRGEHPNNPEKHSRIWENDDIMKICAMDATTELDMIEAIRFGYYVYESQRYKHLSPIIANAKNLRWIEWHGEFASHLLSNFPQRKLCHLKLQKSLQKQLWEGYKLLPNLKTVELENLNNLIMTPDFDGLPNLERFYLHGPELLEEIHPSIGRLEKLVFLSIEFCTSLKMFPPINIPGLQKLETLSIVGCRKLFKLSEIQQQKMENLLHLDLDNSSNEGASYIESCSNFFVICWRCGCSNLPGVECCVEDPCLRHNMKPCLSDNNMNHIGRLFFLKDLKKLDLSYSSLGDEEMGCAVWELPNLLKLTLLGNEFSLLNFSLLQVPRLKWLDVSECKGLVEVSELPSSIAVVEAIDCRSLESFGDISNCKWLWKISLVWCDKLGDGDILLDSMLKGNASEDYFINITLTYQIPKVFVGRMFRVRTFTWCLPDGWYNDFCGFLICVVTRMLVFPAINVVIKQEVDKDSPFELSQESNEAVEPKYNASSTTYVGYISFGSLRHTTFLYSSYTMISFSLDSMHQSSSDAESYVGAQLVSRKSNGDQPQTTKVATDSSEFWNIEEFNDRIQTFTIQDDTKSSVKIKWQL